MASVDVAQDVVAVAAPPQQPLQRLSFALDEGLDGLTSQEVSSREQNHGMSPHVLTQELHVLLHVPVPRTEINSEMVR